MFLSSPMLSSPRWVCICPTRNMLYLSILIFAAIAKLVNSLFCAENLYVLCTQVSESVLRLMLWD